MFAADLVTRAASHIGEAYVFGARTELDNPDCTGPWDCAEFVSWCVFQTYGLKFGTTEYPGSRGPDPFSGAWYQQAGERAALVDFYLAASTPGAILIRKPSRTRAGHVAISAGAGETIEAYSSSRGVIRHKAFSTGRVWHRACFLPGIDYSGDLEAG